MNLLITGGTGFIGRNLVPILKSKHKVFAPRREDLNLFDKTEVHSFLNRNDIDCVIHFANPRPSFDPLRSSGDRMFEDMMCMFSVLYDLRFDYRRMVYTGSGAEYDKTKDISNVKEDEVFQRKPQDDYGLAKQLMNRMASQSSNIVNCRVFGCFGPGELPERFVRHCVDSCLRRAPIAIQQDCKFDYIYVDDLAEYIIWMIEGNPTFSAYNVSGNNHMFLSEIAREVSFELGARAELAVRSPVIGREYTACGDRLFQESGIKPRTTIASAVRIIAEKANSNDTHN